MALLASELLRVKAELAYNVLTIGALPYIGYVAIFDQVIATYMSAGATTTSATAVTASTSGAVPVALTLTSPTGFSVFDQIVVDVDARQEIATVQSVAGSVVTVELQFAHSGTYPVTVEGGEAMVRQKLRQIDAINGTNGALSAAVSAAGIKKVDEIEFFGGGLNGSGEDRFTILERRLMRLRDELAAMLGVPNGWRYRNGRNAGVALY